MTERRFIATQAEALYIATHPEGVLRKAVKPQPFRDDVDTSQWWWFREYHDPDSDWMMWPAESLREVILSGVEVECPYVVGGSLWVAEGWTPYADIQTKDLLQGMDRSYGYTAKPAVYRATYKDGCPSLDVGGCERWRPSTTMPRWASRFTLEITSIDVDHAELWDWVIEYKRGGGKGMRTTAPVSITRNGYEYARLPSPPWGGGMCQITIEPNVQFGQPCVRGTRIPAESIAAFHAAGDSINTITRAYGLTEAQVQACLDYVNTPLKCLKLEPVSE